MNTKLEIFCGLGGVGKTTLSAARALYHAKKKKRTLVITIDPAKRLKDLFHVSDNDSGKIKEVDLKKNFHIDGKLDLLLFNPQTTFNSLLDEEKKKSAKDNHILEILTRPYGSLNETLSLVELNQRISEKSWDVVVLDTPPGKNFLGFLETSSRIEKFFHPKLMSAIQSFSKPKEKKPFFLKDLVGAGINKLFDYLKQVTGQDFLEDFVKALSITFSVAPSFLDSITLLKRTPVQWFLTTSTLQAKSKESAKLKTSAQEHLKDACLLINKSLSQDIFTWEPSNEKEEALKKSLLQKQEDLKQFAEQEFSRHFNFSEIIDPDPQIHLEHLCLEWERYTENA